MFDFYKVQKELSEAISSEVKPDFVRPICVVSGTYYEMGRQYGQQQYDQLRQMVLSDAAELALWEDKQKLGKIIDEFEEYIKENLPESIELWKGISDGAELSYDAVLLHFLSASLIGFAMQDRCSTISAWDSATIDNKIFAGTNADGGAFTATSYSPVLFMYPTDGNALISNGGLISNLAMNEKGMVSMASYGGFDGLPSDIGIGYPSILATTMFSLKYSDAEEACNAAVSSPCAAPENIHFVDKAHGGYVVEHSNGHAAVRRAGEHGEKDFLVTTNHFITDEMQSSKPEDDSVCSNSYSRFKTEMHMMNENCGHIDLEKIANVLSLIDYYDGENWHNNVWDPVYSTWTPEKHAPFNKTYMQTLADPSEKTFYIRQGASCTIGSAIPGVTGNFTKLFLKETPEASLNAIERETLLQLWKYAKENESKRYDHQLLDNARSYIWYGINYRKQSILSNSKEKKLHFIAKAILNFTKAQSLLGMALLIN